MGNVQGKLTFRVHNGVVQKSTDDGATWNDAGGSNTILARAQVLLPSANFDTVLGTDGEVGNWFSTSNFSNGTVTMSATAKGGVIVAASSATANGISQWFPNGAPAYVDNARTTPWYFYSRARIATAVDAVAQCSAGISAVSGGLPAAPGIGFGVIGTVSATNFGWKITNGAGTTVASGTGPVVDTNFHTYEILNDGTTVTFFVDGLSIGTTAATNIAAATPMMLQMVALNGGTAANRTHETDKVWFVCQAN